MPDKPPGQKPPGEHVEEYKARDRHALEMEAVTALEAREQFLDDLGILCTEEDGDGLFGIARDEHGNLQLALDEKIIQQQGDDDKKADHGIFLLQKDHAGRSQLLPPEGSQIDRMDFHGLIPPPYRQDALIRIWDNSSVLPQVIQAMARNIDGFGHDWVPVIDLTADEADEKIREIILEEGGGAREKLKQKVAKDHKRLKRIIRKRRKSRKQVEEPEGDPHGISDEEVEAKREELERAMAEELQQLRNLFEYISVDDPFIQMRQDSRTDEEITGNTYWEILRDKAKNIAGIRRGEAETFRISPLTDWVEIKENRRTGILKFEEHPMDRQFRKYVQIDRRGMRLTWFKELGDPRRMSARNGRFLDEGGKDAEGRQELEEGEKEANELLHFRQFSKGTPYGRPRWIGVMLEVLGIRQAAEVNYDIFHNKMIPPMVIMVSGGKMGKLVEDRLARHIEDNVRGARNYHRILVLEAEPSSGASNIPGEGRGTVRIHLEPLTQHQPKDALFQNYTEQNTERVESAYRLPKLFLGRTKDFNRATAQTAKEVAEEQVFAPERDEFDAIINKRIVRPMGIKFWEFRSKGVPIRNAWDMMEMAIEATKHGLTLPQEMRAVVEEAFQRQLDPLPPIIAKVPMEVMATLARSIGPDIVRMYGVKPEDLEDLGGFPTEPPEDGELPGDDGEDGQDPDEGDKLEKGRRRKISRSIYAYGVLMMNDGGGVEIFPLPRQSDDPVEAEEKAEKIRAKFRGLEKRMKAVVGPALDRPAPEAMGRGVLDGAPDDQL